MESQLVERIEEAAKRGKGFIRKTPLEFSPFLSSLSKDGPKVYLKLESEQVTGSVKPRGAYNKLRVLQEKDPKRIEKGLTAASSGNHALACAHLMQIFRIPGELFTPTTIGPGKKQDLSYHNHVTVTFYGDDCLTAETRSRQLSKEKGIPFFSPYNDVDVLAGMGTMSREVYEDLPQVDAILVSVGGGGLISGTAAFLKHKNPNIKIFGCQPVNTKVMYESVKAGKVVFEKSTHTLSDGTAGGIESDTVTFDLCKRLVDEWILVDEDQISKAVYQIMDRHHKIIEGAAGVAVAAYTNNLSKFENFKNVVVVICGGNISTQQLMDIAGKYGKS